MSAIGDGEDAKGGPADQRRGCWKTRRCGWRPEIPGGGETK